MDTNETPGDEHGRAPTDHANITRRDLITRTRVTQVMGMLRLAPEIREQILSLPNFSCRSLITERMLRPVETIADHRNHLREFRKLVV